MVGKGRMPNFDDRENTPYLRATVLEALRWNPATPTGTSAASKSTCSHINVQPSQVFLTELWKMTSGTDILSPRALQYSRTSGRFGFKFISLRFILCSAARTRNMSRNPAYFPDPTAFKPERHINNQGQPGSTPTLDPRHFVFGFGRRTCPGSELAVHALWMGMATLLWAFEIKPVEGEEGEMLANLGDSERFTFGFTR